MSSETDPKELGQPTREALEWALKEANAEIARHRHAFETIRRLVDATNDWSSGVSRKGALARIRGIVG